jgi:thioredoxin 1
MQRLALLIMLCLALTSGVAGQGKPKSQTTPVVTFVELGSVTCIPCKKMQPVMKAIEQKYAGTVHVIFYDVWTKEQKLFAKQYGIRLIPTQVFLDERGKEFFRHEGFFPEEEIHKILKGRGLTPSQVGG